MRFVWTEDERVGGHYFGPAIFVANSAFSGNHQIQLPLGRVRVIREVALSYRHPAPFQIKRVPLGKVERRWFASQRFRNSFKGDDILSAWRLPRVLFDFVQVNFCHGCKITAEVAEFAEKDSKFSAFSAVKDSLFAIEVIGFGSFHDQLFGSFPGHSPLAAVGIITGISCYAAAPRIIGDHVINKIFIARVAEWVRFTWPEKKTHRPW